MNQNPILHVKFLLKSSHKKFFYKLFLFNFVNRIKYAFLKDFKLAAKIQNLDI